MEFFKRARFQFFFTFLFACIAIACQSSNIEQEIVRDFSDVHLEWKTLEESSNVQFAQYVDKCLLIHCIKINLNDPKIKIKMFCQNENAKNEYAKKFAKKNSLLVAFNTTPFISDGMWSTKKQTPAGICINEGRQYTKALSAYCALGFFKTDSGYKAQIFEKQTDANLQNAYFAAGGFWQILKDGKIIQFEKIRDSRMVCAINESGSELYVFAVEGENKTRSTGLTYMECAEFIKSLGLKNAMEFDGGASTQLALLGRSVLTYKNKVKVPAIIGFSY